MRASPCIKALTARTMLGAAIGTLLSGIVFFTRLKACFLAGGDSFPWGDLSVIEWLWIIISYPARLLFRLWVFVLHLPPHNDVVVMGVLPSIAVVIQWTLIGFVFGLWKCRQRREWSKTTNFQ